MPAWPGGPCPDCGDTMPPNLLRCQTCRAWLNPDLTRPEPRVPEMFSLPEVVPTSSPHTPARPTGHYVICPACRRELRVSDRYVGSAVACKFCQEPFTVNVAADAEPPRVAVFLDCPHCKREIRAASRYVGRKVACKFCEGLIEIEPRDGTPG